MPGNTYGSILPNSKCKSCGFKAFKYIRIIEGRREPVCQYCLFILSKLCIIGVTKGIVRLRSYGPDDYYIDVPSEPDTISAMIQDPSV